jgi:hypothetical protein
MFVTGVYVVPKSLRTVHTSLLREAIARMTICISVKRLRDVISKTWKAVNDIMRQSSEMRRTPRDL